MSSVDDLVTEPTPSPAPQVSGPPAGRFTLHTFKLPEGVKPVDFCASDALRAKLAASRAEPSPEE